MEKSRILAIGCGGTGGKLLNELMSLDRRYTGIFMNTNLDEMINLKHFDRERRCFYISNADGCGKDRKLAETYIKDEAPKFAEMIKKFINQDHVVFLTSANGGTGSKAVFLLSYVVKRFCPEKSLNIVATFPRLNESDIDFKNAVEFWNEIVDYKKKGIIDSVRFIDNNKSKDYKELNAKAMKELDESFGIISGELDSSDSKRVHTASGYKVVLKLDHNDKDTKTAIDKAINSSMYYMPDNFESDIVVGNINTDIYNLETIQNEFPYYTFSKFNENKDDTSYIALGGCEMPKEAIGLILEASKEIENRKKKRNIEEDLIIKDIETSSDNSNTVKVADNKAKLTNKDLDDLFADDDFWN